jgi:SAM-dependent methyltransferase
MKLNVPALMQASSHEEIVQLQRDAIIAHGKQLEHSLSIIEAGCGQRWKIDLMGLNYTLTGIDLDPAALELRKTKARDLDVAICGDLCSVELDEASFDVVYSSFVLEHIQRADIALQNFVRWLRPGGLLILRLPDPGTVRGFFARVLPHRMHVWYYRYIYGSKSAGQPGYAPYPTCYHPVIGRERLCGFLAEHGVICIGCYGDGFRRETSNHAINALIGGISRLVSMLSLGRLNADYADVLYLAVKSAADQES